ncbi:MAG: collagen-like protein, partial [Bacilli bacterium]|nr:collagen-like protein [Bacilli bacterium]
DKNEIQLILTYNDKVISAKTNFTFVKEGESGTNGTDFVCKIIPNGIEGAVVPKYPTVIYNEYTQQYALNYTPKDTDTWFKVQLWHDGELVYTGTESGNTLENKQAKVQWSMLQNTYGKDKQTDELIQDASNFVINKDTAEITFNTTELENPANIVRCVVNYDNVDYYATLPITIIRTKNNLYEVQLVENSGFRNVMYTTDGQSPAFDNQPFELIISQIVEGVKNDISHFETSEFAVDYDWKVKGSVYYSDWKTEENLVKNTLYKSKEKNYLKYFKPVDTYNGLCTTNALVCNITRKGDRLASIHIPIHFYINRYGNAAINGWDGNSISLDEEGGIILAPQVGAGSKNEDNTFTGVFMGSVKEPGAEKEEHGLFGYHNGQRTITLNSEDGSARFGKTGLGQIVIDPTTEEAVIRSGVYDEENGIGMEINLTEPSIKFASGKFEVDKNGNVTADSFATREEVSELEESIQIFNVQVDRDSILIPSTAEQDPIDSQQYVINFTGLYKGKETSYFTAEFISGFDTGITTSIQDNQILFNVDKTKRIQNNVNTYTVQFKFSDVVTVKTYIVNKTITVGLAVQGKDGYQGSDGKSAYQVWLEAGYTGTEEDYLESLRGADGEPGKDGEKGADGETGKSAYQVWLDAGNIGTEAQYLASLKGADGADGQDGAPGKDGEKGDTGIGVSKIVEQYYLSTSNQRQENGDWKETQDPWTSGKYI